LGSVELPNPTVQGALLALSIDRDRPQTPIYVQLYGQLRDLILRGTVTAERRLPSTRTLARMLALSRTTIIAAYDQLESEGYIEQVRGSGAYVCTLPPDRLLNLRTARAGASPDHLPRRIHPDAETPVRRAQAKRPVPFAPHVTDSALFPYREWGRLLGRSWRHPDAGLLWDRDPFGHEGLRRAIAEHLDVWRGMTCDPAQIIITSSAGEALDLVARALLAPGSAIWFEDPGYRSTRAAAEANGLKVVPVAVDGAGLIVEAGIAACDGAGAAVVTPSRQFPLGHTLSVTRRLALLDWARRNGAWIIEDDYDSEYRYTGRPLASLMSLDDWDRMIYMGSFSKVLLSSFRLGFVVVPPGLVEAMRGCLHNHGAKASLVAQPALAEFMASGAYGAYIRKTRRIYARRQGALLAAIDQHLAPDLTAPPQSAGLHVVAWLRDQLARRTDDVTLSHRARDAGVSAPPLSPYYRAAPARQGVILGFAGFSEAQIDAAARRFAEVVKTLIG